MAIWQTAGKVRMTPKGVYNSSTAYEILDIVSNADQTISYIAKQAVPAGTALTNTTYWTVIADVTEALENADAAISYIGDSYSSSSTYAVGDYVIHDGGLYRCETAISTAEAWTAAHWQQVSAMNEIQDVKDDVTDLKSALSNDINGLSYKSYNPNLAFEMGYIDGSTGEEKSNTVNARSTIVHMKTGDIIDIYTTYGGATFHIYSNGTWQAYKTQSGLVSSGYASLTQPTGINKFTALQNFDVRIVVNRTSSATITDLSQAYQIASVTQFYNYKRIDDLESETIVINGKFAKPKYSKTELVSATIAPTTYPVSLTNGHTYKARFKSSSDLNQTSFYLQIYPTQSIADPSNVLKNYGDVWSTDDTSDWLEYTFTADNDYTGYFRFGYAVSEVPSNVTVYEQIYDMTSPEYYELNSFDLRLTYLETHDDNQDTNYWKGKKIVWFGTSIPAGVVNAGDEGGTGAYPTRVGEMLGATVYNEAVGSSAVRIGMHGSISESDQNGYAGVPATCCLLSLSGTVAEKQAIIEDWDTWKDIFSVGVDDVDISNPDKYYNASYERKLAKYLTGGSVGPVDLYVFDHGYNDGGNGNGTNYSDTTDIPTNPLDRTYFIGAMNFLINQIKQDNFRASVIVISHYNDEYMFKDLVDAQEYIANKWNIPFINISNKLGFTSFYSVTIDGITKTMKNWWLPDMIHPSSDPTGKALQHYAEVLFPMIRDVR